MTSGICLAVIIVFTAIYLLADKILQSKSATLSAWGIRYLEIPSPFVQQITFIMKKILVVLALFTGVSAIAQEKGIQFEHGLSWDAVKEKARIEGKYIFVDAFTTWCGPCKMMAKNIFPLPEVGEFFNANFINLKVQLDTTKSDNEEVKRWYADAHKIMTEYRVNAFPTYLFLSPGGKLVHRALGSSPADAFIAKAKDALNPEKQYYTLVARYEAGERAPAFLKSLAEASLNAYDKENSPIYAKAFLATQTDLMTEENIRFLDKITGSTEDEGFALIAANPEAYNKVMGEGMASAKLTGILLQEKIFPQIFGSTQQPDWSALNASLAPQYPKLADEAIARAKIIYYNEQADWPAFSAAVSHFATTYHLKISPGELNNYAWKIFEACDDPACINQALEWSRRSVDIANEPMFIDTYANLLYKQGKKDLAVEWQQKAIKILKEKNEDYANYQQTLDKMKSGQKTW